MHHQSFRSQDCNMLLLREIFNDSQIAAKMSAAGTKTEAIACNVISPHVMEVVDRDLQAASHVSVSADTSNHGNIKLFPIAVQ